jgi:hypothetical protein
MPLAPENAVDPTRCPLCGAANTCAMERERETGRPQPPCWCTQVDFGADLLARIPEDARHKACLCPACAAAAR